MCQMAASILEPRAVANALEDVKMDKKNNIGKLATWEKDVLWVAGIIYNS